MFRVEVADVAKDALSQSIPALYAGKKQGEGVNETRPSFADIDVAPEDYMVFASVDAAQEIVAYLQDKGYEAKILTGKSA